MLAFIVLALSAVPIVLSGETFSCTPTHVWDGDGPIWCEEGPRIRLSGIAAREMDGPCSDATPAPQQVASRHVMRLCGWSASQSAKVSTDI